MARIYWDILDCGAEIECCCRCPHLRIDRRLKYKQQCWHPYLSEHIEGLKWTEQRRRSIEACETPDWCPLPKLEFPEGAIRIISVSPIFLYKIPSVKEIKKTLVKKSAVVSKDIKGV